MGRFYAVFVFIFGAFLSFAQDGTEVPRLRCISTLGQISGSEAAGVGNFKNSFSNPLSAVETLPRYGKQFLNGLKDKSTRGFLILNNPDNQSLLDFLRQSFFRDERAPKSYNDLQWMLSENYEVNRNSVLTLVPLYDHLLLANALKLEINAMPNPKTGILGFKRGPVDDLVAAIDKQTEFVLANPGLEIPSVESFIPEKHRTLIHAEYFNNAFAILKKLGSRLVNDNTEPTQPPFSFWDNAPHPGLEFTAEEYNTEILAPLFQSTALAQQIKSILELKRSSPDETLADLFTSENLSDVEGMANKIEIKKIAKALRGDIDADPNHPIRRIVANALPKLVYMNRILELAELHPQAKHIPYKPSKGKPEIFAQFSHILFDLRNSWLNFEKRDERGMEPYFGLIPKNVTDLVAQILKDIETQIETENPGLRPVIPITVETAPETPAVQVARVPVFQTLELTAEGPIDTTQLNLVTLNQYGDTLINAERELTAATTDTSTKLSSVDSSKLNLVEIDEQLATLDELMQNTEHLITVLEESLGNMKGPKKQLAKKPGKEGAKSRNSTALTVLTQKEEALKTSLRLTQDSFALAEEWFLKLSEIRGKSSSQTSNSPASTTPLRMKPKE